MTDIDKLYLIHSCVIVDINSAIAYLTQAREDFMEGKLANSIDSLGRTLKEMKSAQDGISKFIQVREKNNENNPTL